MKGLFQIMIAFACGLLACFCWQFFADCGVEPQVEKRIPTFEEIQKMVGAEPDGIIGPNTIEKWNRKICDQYGVYYCRKAGMK